MKTYISGLFIFALIFLLSCSVDHGLAPLEGTLNVKVIFRGEAPANTEGIYLVVAPQFPPHAINELYQSPNSLPIDQDTVTTSLALPFGSYEAVALWWYNTETKSNLADILALPLDPSSNLLPLGFDLSEHNPIVDRTLYASWNHLNRDAEIQGTITFDGPFPEHTYAVAVAAFIEVPQENIHFLTWLKSIDFGIDKTPYHYKLPVRRGTTGYVAVFWLKERAALTDFKTVGFYRDPDNPAKPARLNLSSGQVLKGIDIDVDWSALEGQNE